uniref:(northern house mosquito) hypothetical protein n=1 Tax=Culex pipiens TaxID=7175 RepID=A0A8D8AKY8_CULPI
MASSAMLMFPLCRCSKCMSRCFSSKKLLPQKPHVHWLGRCCFLAVCCGPKMSRSGWNGHSSGSLTWYFSRIGSHFDWTILRTTRELSREQDILNTLGPGHGMIDRKQITITSILIDLVHIHNPLSYMPEVRRISVIHWSEIQHSAKTIQHTSFWILPNHTVPNANRP